MKIFASVASLISLSLIPQGFPDDALATILRVPSEYGTIQSAFDSLSSGDTVLVDVGTYGEALYVPPLSFVLLGNVTPDTGDYPRPIIDPSELPGSDSLACLSLPDPASVIVEDMVFRNGPRMFPRTIEMVGGVRNVSGEIMVFRRCLFDSTYGGIASPGIDNPPSNLVLQQCRFDHNSWVCTLVGLGRLQAEDCYFSGRMVDYYALTGADGGIFRRCQFAVDSNLHYFVYERGSDCLIQDCLFGPAQHTMTPLMLYSYGPNNVIEGNLFANLGLIQDVVIMASQTADTIQFRHNTFTANYTSGGSNAFVTMTHASLNGGDGVVAVDSNVFHDTEGSNGVGIAKGISLYMKAILTSNRFIRIEPPEIPVIRVDTLNGNHAISELRGNLFMDNTNGVRSYDLGVDARWNYWGDPSGPYNPVRNPNGQGDAVSDSVLFNPWYPDTSFLAVPGIGKPLPEQFVFKAYPNPFNSTVTFNLIPPEVMIVRVELFDILGRRVKGIWSGPLAFQKQITFDGSDLASGIYFARVWQPIGNRPLAMTKLVLMK